VELNGQRYLRGQAGSDLDLHRVHVCPGTAGIFALESARLPTSRSLYGDEEVLNKLPVAELGREALENARPRPVSPYYSDMSLAMAE
jgi:multiple sugar transport system substrate-binding protein